MGERPRQGGVPLLRARFRDRFADQAQGLVLEDADRLAGPRVAQDLTPGGRGRVLGDAGRPDRGAVCERLVTVEPIHEHGIVRRHRIDPLAPRQRGSLPEGVIPVAARDPFTWLELLGVRFEPPDELLRRGSIAQVDGDELEAAVDEVGMPVREPGHDEPAARGQHLGLSAHVAAHHCGVTDCQDPAALDRHGAGLRLAAGEAGPDDAARDDEVGLAAAGGERHQQQSRQGKAS